MDLEALEMRLGRALGRRPNLSPSEEARLSPMARALYGSLAPAKTDMRTLNRSVRTDVYRFYDCEGALLYVGLSCSIAARVGQHRHDKGWWDSVSRIDVEHFPSRDAASMRERELISILAPLHNQNGGGA